MMDKAGKKLLLLLLCILYHGNIWVEAMTISKTLAYGQQIWLERVLDGLESALAFYKEHYREVNVDSIYGLRVAQGFLWKADLYLSSDEQSQVTSRIQILHDNAKAIADKSLKPLKAKNANYFNAFKKIVAQPWSFSRDFVVYNPKVVVKVKTAGDGEGEDGFDEELSDYCMSLIMGTRKGGNEKPCTIPKKCWDKMNVKGTGGYFITHQALFFLLAEVSGCHTALVKKAGSEEKLEEIFTHLGSNLFYQAKELFKLGVPPDYKDLFMEQVVICGMLGIVQCYDLDWLKLILNWQDISGCYKEPKFAELHKKEIETNEIGHTVKIATEIIESQDDPTQIKEDIGEVAEGEIIDLEKEDTTQKKPGLRKLLEEVELSGGCLAHMTGIATGFFGMYTHWLMNPPDYEAFELKVPWRTTSEPEEKSMSPLLSFIIIGLCIPILFIFWQRVCKRYSFPRSFCRF